MRIGAESMVSFGWSTVGTLGGLAAAPWPAIVSLAPKPSVGLGTSAGFGSPAGSAGMSADIGIRARGGSNAVKKSALQEDNLGSISLSFSAS